MFPIPYFTGMGEADPWPPCPRPGQPDRNQRKVDRDLRDLAEMTGPTAYLTETFEGLAKTAKIMRTWPRADTHQVNLADGRPLSPLTLKSNQDQ